jgi:hypothetical protein
MTPQCLSSVPNNKRSFILSLSFQCLRQKISLIIWTK